MATEERKIDVRPTRSILSMNETQKKVRLWLFGSMESLVSLAARANGEERVKRILDAYSVACSQDSKLLECSMETHYQFVALAVMLDLVPGKSGGGLLWPVAFNGRMTPIIGANGYRHLYQRVEPRHIITARVVLRGEQDRVTVNDQTGEVVHGWAGWDLDEGVDQVIGAYAQIHDSETGKFIVGSRPIRMMTLLARARASQSYVQKQEIANPSQWWTWFRAGSAWASWPIEQMQKTATRFLFQRCGIALQDTQLQMALTVESGSDAGEEIKDIVPIELPQDIPEVHYEPAVAGDRQVEIGRAVQYDNTEEPLIHEDTQTED